MSATSRIGELTEQEAEAVESIRCGESTVVTFKEYNNLVERDAWLCSLEAAGIDNTDAYSHAHEIHESS